MQVVSSHTQKGGSAYGLKWISWCENYSNRLVAVSVTAASLSIFFLMLICLFYSIALSSFLLPFFPPRTSATHPVLTVSLYILQRNYSYAIQTYINSLKVYSHKIFHVHIIYTVRSTALTKQHPLYAHVTQY